MHPCRKAVRNKSQGLRIVISTRPTVQHKGSDEILTRETLILQVVYGIPPIPVHVAEATFTRSHGTALRWMRLQPAGPWLLPCIPLCGICRLALSEDTSHVVAEPEAPRSLRRFCMELYGTGSIVHVGSCRAWRRFGSFPEN